MQKDCVSNLLGDSASFGCTSGSSDEANCLCSNADFTYGIRDCSNEHCSDAAAAASAIAYGISYCSCKIGLCPRFWKVLLANNSSAAGVAIPTTVETVTSGTIVPTVTSTASGAVSILQRLRSNVQPRR